MLTALLIPLVALPVLGTTAPQAGDPSVRVWLSRSDAVWPGDRVRVYAEAQGDGYLVVLHAEPDGRIRVLFPIDPVDDNFVRGGSRYEVLSRGNGEAITVYASEGVGTVLAAFSRDPFRFDELAQAGHWYYRLPDAWWVSEDPESDLLTVADRMAGGVPFDYDVQRYGVSQAVAAYETASSYYGYAYPAYAYPVSGAYLSIGFTFGVPYFAYGYPGSCWDWYYCYPGGWYYHYPYYRPYYYGYYGHYGYPYYGYPYYGSPYYGYPYYPYSPSYPKYAGKGPTYYPTSPGVDYRRRAGASGTAQAAGTASGVGRRTTATGASGSGVSSPAGQSGRRTTPAAGTPTAGGRSSAPAGTREAPRGSDAGRRATGTRTPAETPTAGGRRSSPAGTREAPAPAKSGSDRRTAADQPTGARSVPEKAAPSTGEPSRRSSAGATAKGLRPEAGRQTGQLPERVEPTRNGVPSSRSNVESRSLRASGSSRQAAPARTGAATMPERVVPSRSVAATGRMPTRVPAQGSASAPARAAGSRSVNAGARASLPTRGPSSAVRGAPSGAGRAPSGAVRGAPSGAGRSAPRASSPSMAPRAPAMSAPRAPAPRAPAMRAPSARRPGR